MRNSFCNKKFRSLLFTGSITVIIQFLLMISDTIIIGNILGEQELGAVNVVKPIQSFSVFGASLISIGTSVFYSYEMGKFNKKRANALCGQGVILAVLAGLILLLVSCLGKGFYFDWLNLSPHIKEAASDYLFFCQFVVFLMPLYTVLLELVYSDGDGTVCNVSSMVQIGVNIVASVVLCMRMGILGVGLGTLLGLILGIAILFIHFFRKGNSLKFLWHISIPDTLKVLKCGITDASAYLFMGLNSFIASKFVIYQFSEYYLPVLLVVFNVLELTIVFDGIGQAITPVVNVYRGEKNHVGIKRVMKTAFKYAVAEGIIMTILLFIFGSYVAKLFGLAEVELINITKLALRLVSPFFFCTAVLFLQTTYYMIIEKVFLATAITGIKDWLLPSIMMCVFGLVFGINGVWSGLGLAPFVSVIVVVAILLICYGKKKFPLLLEDETREVSIFDTELSPENVVNLRNQVEEFLLKREINQKSIKKIMLYIEELCMLTYEKNKSRKVTCECSVMIGDDVQIIIRDDGEIGDLTDPDNPVESLRSYVVAHMMIHMPRRRFLKTMGYNRAMFEFEK